MKKILYVLPGIGISGGVAIVFQHVNRLLDRGYDVGILALGEGGDADWFPGNKAEVYRRPDLAKLEAEGIGIAVATHFSTVAAVEKICSERKIYFVQSDERRFDLPSLEEFLMCEKSYGSDMEYMTEALWIQRWLKEEFDKDAYYVPNGLDSVLHRVQSIAPDDGGTRVLLEGAIAFSFKGMEDAYAAAKGTDAKIWIVSSSGVPKPDWEYERFLPSVPFFKMNEVYSSCEIFLKMSRVEGFFGPPMEAMACGCAVVVGKVTGYDEYIRDGYNALVVEQGDIEGARRAVQRLIDDVALRNTLVENGYRTAKEWGWDRSIDLLEKMVANEPAAPYFKEDSPERYDYGKTMKGILLGIFEKEINKRERALEAVQLEREGLRAELSSMRESISEKEREVAEKNQEIALITSSKFWKLRNRYVKVKAFRLRHLRELAVKAYLLLKREGAWSFARACYKYAIHGREYFLTKPRQVDDYTAWIRKYERPDREAILREIGAFRKSPKISIITPVYDVDPEWLERCIRSVTDQLYVNWELCLYDDASTRPETLKCLRRWQGKDGRIKIRFGTENGHISRASNQAIGMATGEYIALLDNDDELSPNALYEVAKLLDEHPETDLVYSDEDKLEMDGSRSEPFFKPDWSLDLLLSENYVNHLGVYRKSIIDAIGGFRIGYEGSQDYDLLLRFVEKTESGRIRHIPAVLYHWRKIPSSTAESISVKTYAYTAAEQALSDYLSRNSIEGSVERIVASGVYRVKRHILGEPMVSIIIPFRDQLDVLKRCLKSIRTKTDYPKYEILLVDNQSADPEMRRFLDAVGTASDTKIKVLSYGRPFNFSAINNFAAKQAIGEYVLLLNNDTEVINEGWLSAMVEQIQREDVGAVGAKLYYPNETIQHAGVIMGLGIAGHAFKHLPRTSFGYFGMLSTIRDYSAVTGACLLTKKALFDELHGLEEERLGVAYNDVDYCLRVRTAGYKVLYTPFAELYHHESLSRGDDAELEYTHPEKYRRVVAERQYMAEQWSEVIADDPYYNRNLTRTREDFSLRN